MNRVAPTPAPGHTPAPAPDSRHIYLIDDDKPPKPGGPSFPEVGLYSDNKEEEEEVQENLLGSKQRAPSDYKETRGGFPVVELLPDNCGVVSLAVVSFVLLVALVLLYATEPTVATSALHALHKPTPAPPSSTPVTDSAPMSPYGKGGEGKEASPSLPHSSVTKKTALEKYAQAGMKTIVSHDGPAPIGRGIPFPDTQGMEPRPKVVLREIEAQEVTLAYTLVEYTLVTLHVDLVEPNTITP